MNANKLIAIAAFATIATGATSAALAQEATVEPAQAKQTQVSTLTRADVLASLAKARADGSIHFARDGYLPTSPSTLSREAVAAATRAAVRSGELQAINATVYGYAPEQAAAVMALAAR